VTPVNFSFLFLLFLPCVLSVLFLSFLLIHLFLLKLQETILLRCAAIFARPATYRQGSQCNVLSIVCSLRVGRPDNRVRFLAGADIFVFHVTYAQVGGFHLDSYPLGALDFRLWARNLPLSFSLERPTCLCNRCRRRGGGGEVVVTSHRGPAVRKGARNPNLLKICVCVCVCLGSFVICRLYKFTLKRRIPSHSATERQSFRFGVKISSRFGLAGRPVCLFFFFFILPGLGPAFDNPFYSTMFN